MIKINNLKANLTQVGILLLILLNSSKSPLLLIKLGLLLIVTSAVEPYKWISKRSFKVKPGLIVIKNKTIGPDSNKNNTKCLFIVISCLSKPEAPMPSSKGLLWAYLIYSIIRKKRLKLIIVFKGAVLF